MKISRLPTAYLNKILNILFPPECITCNSEITEAYTMCDLCWKKLDFITEPNCAKCSLPIQSIALEQKCDINCLHIQHQYSTAKSVFVYESVTRELIHKLKYSTYYQIAQFFAKLIYNRFAENIKNCDVVIPVPMHYLRLKERGYNQSSILAVKVAHTLKIKYIEDALVKTRNTASQMTLNETIRQTSVSGAFEVNCRYLKEIKGKKIAIIDDVFTTGSTVNECTKVLLANDVSDVAIFTIAKTVKKFS